MARESLGIRRCRWCAKRIKIYADGKDDKFVGIKIRVGSFIKSGCCHEVCLESYIKSPQANKELEEIF